ncbi:MAG: ABC transporter permease [Pseudomonadales bacterium]
MVALLDNARLAWRNLWRNRRRTLLLSSAVAFALILVVFSRALQFGSHDQMRESATSLLTGQMQIQQRDYQDDPKPRLTVPNADTLLAQLRSREDVVAVSPRLVVFTLVSYSERSFAAQVIGTDIDQEMQVTRILKMAQPPVTGWAAEAGTASPDAVPLVVGTTLAKNLGAGIGSELVLLGTGRDGGVAVLVGNIASLISSGLPDLDRAFVMAPIEAVRSAFDYGDEAHQLALRAIDLPQSVALAQELNQELPERIRALSWSELLPDLKQAIDIDRLSALFFYYLLLGIVAFSVLNAFVMIFFERTREFGLLSALGMKRGSIQALLHWEAFFLWALGTVIGMAILLPLLWWLQRNGLYLGEQMEAYAATFYMPARIYPTMAPELLANPPILLLVGCQLAVLIAAFRIWRLRPVDALRAT